MRAGTQELSDGQIEKLLDADLDAAVAEAKAVFPNFAELSDARQRVLADMTFNLGRPRLEEFKLMIAAVKGGDFAGAADEMKASAWYKQVKDRGKALERMMRTGAGAKN